MARTIQLPVTMQAAVRKADDSVKLNFTTNLEVSTDDFVLIDSYRRQSGYLLFRENEFTDADIPAEDAPNDTKTPSQRLRSTLYVYHQQQGITEPFNIWYATQVEKFISSIKERLE